MTRGWRSAALGLMLSAAIGGCGLGAAQTPLVTPPRGPATPGEATSPAIAQARAALVQALGTERLFLDVPQVPFRPPESPALAAAPREVFQAVLPDDPTHGYIAVYEFPTAAAAAAAATEQAAYISSGPGRVQFPRDTQFILRLLGTTVVFHAYSRENSTDPRAADVVTALQNVGAAVPIPR